MEILVVLASVASNTVCTEAAPSSPDPRELTGMVTVAMQPAVRGIADRALIVQDMRSREPMRGN